MYRLLNRYSPINSDCGFMCGAACCMQSDEDMGIFMLPGEEQVHDMTDTWLTWTQEDPAEYDLSGFEDTPLFFAQCSGPAACKREIRPIQCRTFPLMPYIDEDGRLEMIYDDRELPYSCALIDIEIPLNDDFVKATRTVWRHLMRDRRIYYMVEADSEALRQAMNE